MARVLLSKADIGPVEERYVLEAVRSGWVAPLGPHVDAFETEIAARVGVRHALALSSGTAALHLALLGLGAGPGSVVVVPTMTFAASANAVCYTGARPVFVDSDTADGNVDAELLVRAVDALRREGTRVAAVMSVDLFGRCAAYADFEAELASRGVPLLEDACEALGSRRAGRAAGSFGAAAALSFNGNKIITTSGGGMLLSDDADLVARARHLSTQARAPLPWYEHTEVGFNYRLSNVLAALGRAQLTRLDGIVSRRRLIGATYARALADVPGIRFLGDPASETESNCWLTALVLDPAQSPVGAETLIKGLAEEDIEARHLWKPMHAQPVYAGEQAFVTGAADALFANGVVLPSGSSLTADEVDHVVSSTRRCLGMG
ncbi:MAG TPA: aminotransferase class I/II-fold pyridoxal phosphate-dependent enzyme [Dermatophilaceae bacterium]|nr:aminotransferase class I/II-fold pyridoxal phosphate-dependent enzyme [Dermatophilaceae bacterium]